jgi:uncharacterized surface protein with fasciclin (FAS1) repeats
MRKSSGRLRAAIIIAVVAVVAATALGVAGCGSSSTTDKTIPDAAAATKDTTKWADAAGTNGLSGTLSGKGPFTVFASSNTAVDKAGASALTGDVQKAMIVEGTAFTKADLAKGMKNSSMLDGNDVVTYTGSDGNFYMNSMKVTAGPIQAKNGVIYVVEGLVTPK